MVQHLTGKVFLYRLRLLMLVTWTVPPVFGLLFLIYLNIFTPGQLREIMYTPLEPLFNIIWILLATWLLPRTMQIVADFIDNPDEKIEERVTRRLQHFLLYYLGAFLLYILMAPTSVMISALHYSNYIATPIDWFRIHLVALIVSILVGLPIMFLVLDLFGVVASRLNLQRPHVTLKTKVFLIGALVPLLIDTMFIQYYWTRTGFFSFETFVVWVVLELLAIGGSLIFVRSIGQSLSPLQRLFNKGKDTAANKIIELAPASTDELGVIANDYRHLLAELELHQNQLEKQVELRTTELISINKELEAFAYSVSHDLRSPLRTINGFSHILLESYADELSEEARDYLQRIAESSSNMSQVIDALLNLSRVSRSSLNFETLDISAMVNGIFAAHLHGLKGHQIETRVQSGLTARADKGMTHILLENLISNALKFSARRKPAIIEFGQVEINDARYFYIRDNGDGFEMRYADKLFKAFQRLHSKQEYDGIGIGLATVQRIVNMHGGRVWAEAKPDEGATFYFSL